MAKRYNSRYDALEAVLSGTFDFENVKTAAQIKAEREESRIAAQAEVNRKKYVQLENILSYSERDQRRLRYLQAVIDNPAAAPQEKESARKSIEKIKSKGERKL